MSYGISDLHLALGATNVISDITTDLDISNILYICDIPQVDQSKSKALQSLVTDIKEWRTWETNKCEETVQGKVNGGYLPSDDSTTSKTKRTAYRVKVLEYLRNVSPWIITTSSTTQAPIKVPGANDPGEQPLEMAIVHGLTAMSDIASNTSYKNLLKAVGAGFSPGSEMIQPYFHTIVAFRYDNKLQEFIAALQTMHFKITMDLPDSGTTSEDATLSSPTAEIQYSTVKAWFAAKAWKEHKLVSVSTELGEELIRQKTFDFLATS